MFYSWNIQCIECVRRIIGVVYTPLCYPGAVGSPRGTCEIYLYIDGTNLIFPASQHNGKEVNKQCQTKSAMAYSVFIKANKIEEHVSVIVIVLISL